MAPPILVLITQTSGGCDVAYWPLADVGWRSPMSGVGGPKADVALALAYVCL
jgi:hypothetical protein